MTSGRAACALISALVLAGCAAFGPASPEQPPDALPEDSPDTDAEAEPASPLEEAVAITAAPSYCQLLLENLESSRPLLEGLDERLAAYTERLETTVDSLDRPEPASRPVECPAVPDTVLGDRDIIGSMEWLYMDPPRRHYRARVDSGVETSLLSARNIAKFERDGDDWVRFVLEDGESEPVDIELPIERTILMRNTPADEPERRWVVEMDLRLGQRLERTEFALTDHSRMFYPVVLGRAFLLDLYVIDVAESYTHPRYEAP